MTYALVLGGGGVTGNAWETGLLRGLRDAGLDLAGAALIVATSTGALLGAQIATGASLDDVYRRQVERPRRYEERPPALGKLVEFFAARARQAGAPGRQTRPTPELLAWIGGQARACSTKISEASRLEVIKARLPVHEWPERPLVLTAIDTADGWR